MASAISKTNGSDAKGDFTVADVFLEALEEMVAISAADGYARATRKPQCVLVHVDVGTSALGQALHTASSGKTPILIFAGQAPYTLYGELPGSRSEHVQWYQDVPNQASIVAPFARYTNEIKSGEHVKMIVNRALLMASTGSCGPSYLTATREALAASASGVDRTPKPKPLVRLGGLPEDAVQTIGDALLEAESPLVVTGYIGRHALAVKRLIALAELVKGLRVFDFESREMSFPSSHRAWVSRSTGAGPAIKEADLIVVLDADVPWIPTKVKPGPLARIFHIDVDPRKEKMQLFDIFAEASFHAECHIVVKQLHDYISSTELLTTKQAILEQRWASLGETHAQGQRLLTEQALLRSDNTISMSYLSASLKRVLPEETHFVHDVVTNQVTFTEQIQADMPGTNLSKGSSGLGWAGGAAIGIKLALDKYDVSEKPELKICEQVETTNLVCMVTGDGSFIFGVPSAVYWAQHRLKVPFLSIVVNNGGWKATRACIKDVHPDGLANQTTDEDLGIDLHLDGPDYVGIAVAASNHTLWGRRVTKAQELEAILQQAVMVVQEEKRGALIEVLIS